MLKDGSLFVGHHADVVITDGGPKHDVTQQVGIGLEEKAIPLVEMFAVVDEVARVDAHAGVGGEDMFRQGGGYLFAFSTVAPCDEGKRLALRRRCLEAAFAERCGVLANDDFIGVALSRSESVEDDFVTRGL